MRGGCGRVVARPGLHRRRSHVPTAVLGHAVVCRAGGRTGGTRPNEWRPSLLSCQMRAFSDFMFAWVGNPRQYAASWRKETSALISNVGSERLAPPDDVSSLWAKRDMATPSLAAGTPLSAATIRSRTPSQLTTPGGLPAIRHGDLPESSPLWQAGQQPPKNTESRGGSMMAVTTPAVAACTPVAVSQMPPPQSLPNFV